MMKAIVVARHGPPEVLELRDVPIPEPLPGEVLVHNHFVGVNFVDTQKPPVWSQPSVRMLSLSALETGSLTRAIWGATIPNV